MEELPSGMAVEYISFPQNKNIKYEELIEIVKKQLPNEDFILLAESYSGYIAYRIALMEPPHLKQVIFVASFLDVPNSCLLKLFGLMPLKFLLARPVPRFISRHFLFEKRTPISTIELFNTTLSKVPADVLISRIDDVLRLPRANQTANVPAVYLQASNDRLVPSRELRIFSKLFDNLKIISVNGPHFLLQSRPVECASHVCRVYAFWQGAQHTSVMDN